MTTNVETTTRATTPPPLPGADPVSTGVAGRGGPLRARGGPDLGHTPDVETAPAAEDLFLPEPEPGGALHVISVDDHVVEPPDTFEGRLPARWRTGRRGSSRPAGPPGMGVRGEHYTQVGMNAVAGRRPDTVRLEPFRFDQMRPGCYDADAACATWTSTACGPR